MAKLRIIPILIVLVLISCANQNWLTKETDHLIIYYKPNSCAAREINQATKTYEDTCKWAMTTLGLKVADNKMHCYLFEPSWWHKSVGCVGYALKKKRRVYYAYSQNIKLCSGHEMMHIFLNDINPNVPFRLEEGICRFYETRTITTPDKNNPENVAEFPCKLYRLAKLEPPKNWKVSYVFSSGYRSDGQGNIAAAFVSYLMKQMGKEAFYSFYRKLDSKNWKSLLTTKLNLSFDEIDQAFFEYGKSLKNPPAVFGMVPTEWGSN